MALKFSSPFKNFNFLRSFSTSRATRNLVITEVNEKTGYATISLNRPPVNSLNAVIFRALSAAFDDMERNRTRGVILGSTSPKIFSAGLEITQLCDSSEESLRELWAAAQDSWLKLFGSSFPSVAALHGHTIAGGCLLAMSCEYRVMMPNFKFGINEIQVGVAPPQLIVETMKLLVSRRELELALMTGKLYSTEEALRVGLVNEAAENKEEVMKKCEGYLNTFRNIPYDARAVLKKSLRKTALDSIRLNRERDIENFIKAVKNDESQFAIKSYLKLLKSQS